MSVPLPLPYAGNPPLSYRFGVLFFVGGVKYYVNLIDTLFQKVSGITSTVNTMTIEEGGQNLYSQKVPQKIQHDNLVLERGIVTPSPLSIEFNIAMSRFAFRPSTVLVNLLDNTRIPIASWLFINAYPVKWSISDLDANQNTVVIETMELAYQRVQSIRL